MPAQPLFVSSGDLVADRRYQWALDYLKRGDAAAAADILRQVVETAPGFATAWFALASIREATGDRDGAIAAFEAARDADREDYHGARLHLARLGVGEATPAMTGVYVRRLFDQHAPEFDRALVERLDYRGPELCSRRCDRRKASGSGSARCSISAAAPGLGGAAFRPYCDWLAGVDISPGMVEQARAKGLYDRLEVADLLEFLAAEAGAQHHLVLAADVFVYCSDLAPDRQSRCRGADAGRPVRLHRRDPRRAGRAAAGNAALRPRRDPCPRCHRGGRAGTRTAHDGSTRTEKGAPVRGPVGGSLGAAIFAVQSAGVGSSS